MDNKIHGVSLTAIYIIDPEITQFSFSITCGNDVDATININVRHTIDVVRPVQEEHARKRLREALMALGGHMAMNPP